MRRLQGNTRKLAAGAALWCSPDGKSGRAVVCDVSRNGLFLKPIGGNVSIQPGHRIWIAFVSGPEARATTRWGTVRWIGNGKRDGRQGLGVHVDAIPPPPAASPALRGDPPAVQHDQAKPPAGPVSSPRPRPANRSPLYKVGVSGLVALTLAMIALGVATLRADHAKPTRQVVAAPAPVRASQPAPTPAPPGFTLEQRVRARLNAGHRCLSASKLKSALAEYRRALEIAPQDPLVHRSLAIVYTRLGDTKRAILEYQTYLRLNPQSEEAPRVREILGQFGANS